MRLGMKPIEPELASIDALKTRADVLRALINLHHEYAGSFFFGSGTGQDAMDSSTVIVELLAGGLGLPDRDYYTKTDAKSVTIRQQYVAYIQKLLVLPANPPKKQKRTPMRPSRSSPRWPLPR